MFNQTLYFNYIFCLKFDLQALLDKTNCVNWNPHLKSGYLSWSLWGDICSVLFSSKFSSCDGTVLGRQSQDYCIVNVMLRVKMTCRYVNDGRPFWQHIVTSSTGCSDDQYFEELYNYYTTDKAWHIVDPEAEKVFDAIRKAGVKVAIVSNFDTRLRPLLRALNCDNWFDALAVSAEVSAEKPNPMIFLRACELLGVNPEDAVHVGDDRRNDIWGARDAGCDAWLWGSDVHSFKEVARRIGVRV
ncbi:Nanp [Linum grandiflorum]